MARLSKKKSQPRKVISKKRPRKKMNKKTLKKRYGKKTLKGGALFGFGKQGKETRKKLFHEIKKIGFINLNETLLTNKAIAPSCYNSGNPDKQQCKMFVENLLVILNIFILPIESEEDYNLELDEKNSMFKKSDGTILTIGDIKKYTKFNIARLHIIHNNSKEGYYSENDIITIVKEHIIEPKKYIELKEDEELTRFNLWNGILERLKDVMKENENEQEASIRNNSLNSTSPINEEEEEFGFPGDVDV